MRVDPHNKPILQFCTGGVWGYICARRNQVTQAHKNADVVCQQLDGMLSNEGYAIGERIYCFYCFSFLDDITVNATELGLSPAGPIHYGSPYFTCTGYETELRQCPHTAWGRVQADASPQQCSNSLYAAASCKPAGIYIQYHNIRFYKH